MSINEIVKHGLEIGTITKPTTPQGVSKEKITAVLSKINRAQADIQDAVFALLDESPSWYSSAPLNSKFSDGASTAHIGAHIAIVQRGSDSKLDREGRDYWIKPLIEVGAIEPCYLPSKKDKALIEAGFKFYPGHLKAKSPNSCYRLAQSFVEILKGDDWEERLSDWIDSDKVRKRLELQAEAAAEAKKMADNSHTELIQASINHYVPAFLSGYEVLYVDDGDGDRITDEQKERLAAAGLTLELGDAMPDVLLWQPNQRKLWVIEAVTSDGEVDSHKVTQMNNFAKRHNVTKIGFTTTYPTWKKFAERQKTTKSNLAMDSYVWILEAGSSQLKVSAPN